MNDPFEQDREDFAVGERFYRESTEAEALEAIELGAEEEERQASRDELDKALRDYAASVKKFGKAMTQLGRPCDKEAA